MSEFTRKEFLRLLRRLLEFTGLAAIIAPIVAFFYPPELEEMPSEPMLVGLMEDLPLNSSKTVRFGRYPAIVIHTPSGLRAYSAVCTHFACIVKWDPEIEQIVCPCHDGFFNPLDGGVISGPPPTPLESLPVQVLDGEIFVGGEA